MLVTGYIIFFFETTHNCFYNFYLPELKSAPGLSQILVLDCDMTLYIVYSLEPFFRVGYVCLAAGPGRRTAGLVLWSGMSWLGESQLRLPDTGAKET